jgi:hypothetical protein
MTSEAHATRRELELLYLGDSPVPVARHAETCETCRHELSALKAERDALLERLPSPLYIKRLRAEHARSRRLKTTLRALSGALAMAAAGAGVLLWSGQASWFDNAVRPSARLDRAAAADQLRPKGSAGLFIIRKRGAVSSVVQERVTVLAGDELRLRFVLETGGPVLAGILSDAGEWLTLFEQEYPAGVHAPLATLRVTEAPGGGRVLLGSPAEVAAARAGRPANVEQATIVWLASE